MGNETERRRFPRVILGHEHFRANGRLYAVLDLSVSGMALRISDTDDFGTWAVGRRLQGTLGVLGKHVSLGVVVRNVASAPGGGGIVGLQFEDPLGTGGQIDHSQWPELWGAQLRPIPHTAASGELWFHGGAGVDVFFNADARLVLILMGDRFIRLTEKGGAETGSTKRTVRGGGSVDRDNGVIQWEERELTADSSSRPEAVTQTAAQLAVAKRLLLSSKIPEPARGGMLSLLR